MEARLYNLIDIVFIGFHLYGLLLDYNTIGSRPTALRIT